MWVVQIFLIKNLGQKTCSLSQLQKTIKGLIEWPAKTGPSMGPNKNRSGGLGRPSSVSPSLLLLFFFFLIGF